MKIVKWLKNLFSNSDCKYFHRWRNYGFPAFDVRSFRTCSKCGLVQEWRQIELWCFHMGKENFFAYDYKWDKTY